MLHSKTTAQNIKYITNKSFLTNLFSYMIHQNKASLYIQVENIKYTIRLDKHTIGTWSCQEVEGHVYSWAETQYTRYCLQ